MALLLLLLAALLAGVLASISVLAGVILVGVLAAVGILALGRRVIPVFHGSLLVILAGYAFIGKGFAYLGAPPLYVGEMVLALCLASIIWSIGRARLGVLHALLLLFMGWGAIRTVPYIGVYGIDALRDAATWVYGFFAIGVSLTVRPEHLGRLATGYRRFIPLFLLWVPIAAGLTFTVGNSLPNTPGSDVPILIFKAGDYAVQLAGVGAFLLLGLYHETGSASAARELVLWAMWLVGAGLTSALNRAAFVSLAAVSAVVLFVRASSRWISLLAVGALLVILTTFLDPTVELGGPRAISVDQVVSNLTSVFSSEPGSVNEATKEWRVAWWNAIVNYTVNGPYFWTGKGFGINLANADGFQVLSDGSLRAPHSTHLEVLARAGVPGLVLWLAFQIGFAVSLLRATFRSYRTAPAWLPVLGWVFVYWLAAIIDGSFDVYLGGPQGGIWFWSAIGLGIAAIRLSAEHPDLDLSDGARRAADDGRTIGRLRPAFATGVPAAAVMGAAPAMSGSGGFAPPAGLPPVGTPPPVAPRFVPPSPAPEPGPPATPEPVGTSSLDADAAALGEIAAPKPKTTSKRTPGATRSKQASPAPAKSRARRSPTKPTGAAGAKAFAPPTGKTAAKGATTAPVSASVKGSAASVAKPPVAKPVAAKAAASTAKPSAAWTKTSAKPVAAATKTTSKPPVAKAIAAKAAVAKPVASTAKSPATPVAKASAAPTKTTAKASAAKTPAATAGRTTASRAAPATPKTPPPPSKPTSRTRKTPPSSDA